ncbi:hypothetical protein [Actibacterium ureilyticum]|uniref:hypothetical protein n=1 Tax=Actibacterium ureilyticum TaxID=1590614 RepID=UPI000BAAE20C|nr:hypothetical protein [Actibacterium ureilyticum]
MRRRLLLLLVCLLAPGGLWAANIGAVLPGAELRGSAVFRFLGVPLYEARLYTPGGQPFDWQQDFALELRYRKGLSQRDLVDSTLVEMDRLGAAPPVRDQLERCFQDVARGDRYLAVTRGADAVRFWRNGVPTCTLAHPRITRDFMAIFLGERTRSRAFTRKLQGL